VNPDIGVDTDQLLDKCSCGAWGAFNQTGERGHHRWYAECSEHCGMITNTWEKPFEAMVQWNKEMRK
jgi:hypothetical protein